MLGPIYMQLGYSGEPLGSKDPAPPNTPFPSSRIPGLELITAKCGYKVLLSCTASLPSSHPISTKHSSSFPLLLFSPTQPLEENPTSQVVNVRKSNLHTPLVAKLAWRSATNGNEGAEQPPLKMTLPRLFKYDPRSPQVSPSANHEKI